MKTAARRVISIYLVFTLLTILIPLGTVSVWAESPTSGECGSRQYWNYDASTATLSITCTDSFSKMFDYSYEKAPWFAFRKSVRILNADSGIRSVGKNAFNNFTSLEIVNMPGVDEVGDSAFERCTALRSVLLSSECEYSGGEIGNYAFAYCKSLTKITIPFSQVVIGSYAFYGCENLKTLGIDVSAKIGDNAFSNCTQLTSIYMIRNGRPFNNSVSDNAFSGVTADVYYNYHYPLYQNDMFGGQLTYKKMTSGLIGYNAYWDYDQPNQLLTISGEGTLFAFSSGSDLPWMDPDYYDQYYSYTETNTTHSYRHMLFSDIETVIIEDGITEIPSYAFELMGKVESVSLPNTLLRLYLNAFNACESLTEIVIPSSVEYVAKSFECDRIYYLGTEEEWNAIYDKGPYFNTPYFLVYHPSTQACNKAGYPAHYEFDGTENHTYYDLNKIAITVPVPSLGDHIFSDNWTTDSNSHWHTCSVCGKATTDISNHIYTNLCDTTCNICRYERTITHSFPNAWTSDSINHWRTCSVCGEKADFKSHIWDDGTVSNAVTCTKNGVRTFTCTVCGTTKTETVSKTGHNYGIWTKLNDSQHQRICANDKTHIEKAYHAWNDGEITIAATCTTDGIKTLTCTVCKATKQETISSTGHNWRSWTRLDDSQHKRVCANDPTHVETALHIWDDGQVTKAPTCTTAGTIKYTCSGCGATTTVPGNAALGHDWGKWAKLNDTQHQRVCANDKSHVETAQHTWDDGQEILMPTCTAVGLIKYTCTGCRAKMMVPGNAVLGHNWSEWEKLNDTQHQHVCTNNNSHVEKENHKWDNGKITTAATCTEKGVKTYTCTVCKATKTEEIAAKGHTSVTDKAVAATCTADGKTQGSHCSVCNTVIKAQESVKATGHNYGTWTKLNETQHQRVCANDKNHIEKANHTWDGGKVTTEPTCTEKGVTTFTCTVCGATKTEETAAKGHTPATDKAVSATCTADGKTQGSHCSVCNAVIKAQETVKATGHAFGEWAKLDETQHQRICANDKTHVEKANHTWDDGKVTTEPTCTEKGVRTYTCAVCGATKTEEIAATDHNAITDPAVSATCTTDGKTEGSHCSVCNTVIKAQEVVKAAGHTWDEGKVTKEPTSEAEGVKSFTCTVCGETKTEPIPKKAPATPTDATPTDAERKPGDVDGDGSISSADARLALRASVGLEPDIVPGADAYLASDVDGDGKVTSADARLILRASVGLEDASKFGKKA